MKNYFLGFVLIFVGSTAWPMDLPTNMTISDLREVIRIVTTNTSTKILSNPYPLGGYPGFEVGVSLETVDASDLASLGAGTTSTDLEIQFPKISVGKGLYKNVDIFFHFAPLSGGLDVNEFGSLLRWSFYETQRIPMNISFVTHGNHMNYGDKILGTTLGIEMLLAVNVNKLAVYFGGGHLQTTGQASVSLMEPAISANERQLVETTLQQMHTFVGLTFHQDNFFVAAQLDRYPDPVFSAKLGLRL